MAPGLDWSVHTRCKESDEKSASVRSGRGEGRTMGSRRIFAPQFKLQVLDSYRKDADCRGNQRATARKYGIHRRQIQKWLQVEASLRTAVEVAPAAVPEVTALNLCADAARQRDDSAGESRQATCQQSSDLCSEKTSHPTRVTLFPRIKVELTEPQTEQKGVRVSLFPSVRVEVSKSEEAVRIKEEEISEEDDMDEINVSNTETEQALDFTCATLSRRRSFSLQFKLEVLNAFHSDRSCHGNQRATARKFGINRRQVQKWLGQEPELRGEAAFRGGLYRQRLGRLLESEEGKRAEENDRPSEARVSFDQPQHPESIEDQCWDLSNKKRKAEPVIEVPQIKKRATEMVVLHRKEYVPYENAHVTSSVDKMYTPVHPGVQETALCLVKVEGRVKESIEGSPKLRHPEVSSSVDKIRQDLNTGPVLFHPNREHSVTPPPYILPSQPAPVGSFAAVPTFGGLHHMLNLCRGLVGECKVRRHTYPLDFKLDALDCYHGNSECHGNQRAVASKFGVHRRQIQKWLQQETQLRQRSTSAHVLNMFR